MPDFGEDFEDGSGIIGQMLSTRQFYYSYSKKAHGYVLKERESVSHNLLHPHLNYLSSTHLFIGLVLERRSGNPAKERKRVHSVNFFWRSDLDPVQGFLSLSPALVFTKY